MRGEDEAASQNFIHSHLGGLETDFFKRTTIIRFGISGESMGDSLVRLLHEEDLDHFVK